MGFGSVAQTGTRDRKVQSQLIAFAWAVEVVGVGCGMANSAYTTFGNHFPTEFIGWLPALPLAVLAATELLRVPFAQSIIRKRSLLVRVVALAGLIALTGLALENWMFGLERIVALRLEPVTAAKNAYRAAEIQLQNTLSSIREMDTANKSKREELGGRMSNRHELLRSLESARNTADVSHQANLAAIRQTCLKTAKNDNCARDRSLEEDGRYAEELNRLAVQQAQVREDLSSIQRQIDELTITDAQLSAGARVSISQLELAAGKARENMHLAVEANQIYRLASMWFQVGPEQLSQEQFSQARGFFCVFGALIIALAGSLAAFIGACANKGEHLPLRDRRFYRALLVLLKRKAKVRTVTETVEKISYQDRDVRTFVYVPVDPQTGLVLPFGGQATFPGPSTSGPRLLQEAA